VAVLLLFCLVAFLPGFFQIPPVDRDEARFAQATKQMIESGQYVDIRFQNVQRANAIGLRYVLSRHIEGFNISFGRPVVLTVFRSMVR
jgi:4-amino-4-deoxy-L-arabinose transferase-like glycosyltransferase